MSDELEHGAKSAFRPMPEGRVFVNAAYMTPKPAEAIDAIQAIAERYASPDFGASEFFDPAERVRERLARLVGGEASRYSLTGSVSFGTATLAWNLRTQADALVGGRRTILGLDGQFPSNVQTWEKLATHGFELRLVEAGEGATDRLLSALADDVALVALEPLSWTDGRRIDVRRVAERSRECGALCLLDVTQSAGVDAPLGADLACDVVVGAGYKWLLGPYGTGFMRLSADLQERLEPLEWNWKNFAGSSDFNRLTEYRGEYGSPAAKFDHGESSAFLRLAGWEAGLRVLERIELAQVHAHCRRFAARLRNDIDPDRFAVSDTDSVGQAAHLFRVQPRDTARFDELSRVLRERGVVVSRRAGGWRVSPHVYNGGQDLQAFVAALGGDY